MEAFIIDGIRTPIGNLGGSLSAVRTDDLAALVIRALAERNPKIPLHVIDDVILGCANQAGEDNRNIARMALLLAGLPVEVPGETVNRLCASGMSAVMQAARASRSGDGNIFIAGGVEHMTRGPWVMSKSSRAFGNDAQLFDSTFGWRFVNEKMHARYGTDPMGMTAENLVEKYGISREDQDLFACRSQMKAANAAQQGRWTEEIIPVSVPSGKNDSVEFKADEFIKGTTTIEKLAQLKPAFKPNGTVTAGNSSGLNDGAAALFIASAKGVADYSLQPKAKIISSAVVGVEPRIMGIGPVTATQKALQKAGMTLDQIDVIELNEAFAAQCLACTRALNISDDDKRVNPNGGAIALGHPLGMSGARLVLTATLELHRQNKRFALATMCVGVGQGYAVILEKV